eukprot:Rhum_TRINITY_DN1579_c0_g1::Rhum_TRINITY_DN1579_c0_g1_i1::g.4455::m.4455
MRVRVALLRHRSRQRHGELELGVRHIDRHGTRLAGEEPRRDCDPPRRQLQLAQQRAGVARQRQDGRVLHPQRGARRHGQRQPHRRQHGARTGVLRRPPEARSRHQRRLRRELEGRRRHPAPAAAADPAHRPHPSYRRSEPDRVARDRARRHAVSAGSRRPTNRPCGVAVHPECASPRRWKPALRLHRPSVGGDVAALDAPGFGRAQGGGTGAHGRGLVRHGLPRHAGEHGPRWGVRRERRRCDEVRGGGAEGEELVRAVGGGAAAARRAAGGHRGWRASAALHRQRRGCVGARLQPGIARHRPGVPEPPHLSAAGGERRPAHRQRPGARCRGTGEGEGARGAAHPGLGVPCAAWCSREALWKLPGHGDRGDGEHTGPVHRARHGHVLRDRADHCDDCAGAGGFRRTRYEGAQGPGHHRDGPGHRADGHAGGQVQRGEQHAHLLQDRPRLRRTRFVRVGDGAAVRGCEGLSRPLRCRRQLRRRVRGCHDRGPLPVRAVVCRALRAELEEGHEEGGEGACPGRAFGDDGPGRTQGRRPSVLESA